MPKYLKKTATGYENLYNSYLEDALKETKYEHFEILGIKTITTQEDVIRLRRFYASNIGRTGVALDPITRQAAPNFFKPENANKTINNYSALQELNKKIIYNILETNSSEDFVRIPESADEIYAVLSSFSQPVNSNAPDAQDQFANKCHEIHISDMDEELKIDSWIKLTTEHYYSLRQNYHPTNILGYNQNTASELADKLQTFCKEQFGIVLPSVIDKNEQNITYEKTDAYYLLTKQEIPTSSSSPTPSR